MAGPIAKTPIKRNSSYNISKTFFHIYFTFIYSLLGDLTIGELSPESRPSSFSVQLAGHNNHITKDIKHKFKSSVITLTVVIFFKISKDSSQYEDNLQEMQFGIKSLEMYLLSRGVKKVEKNVLLLNKAIFNSGNFQYKLKFHI